MDLVELPGADECCGFGGSFSVRLPEVSTAILDKKLANVERTAADRLVACDAGCLMQMGGGLSRQDSRVRALLPPGAAVCAARAALSRDQDRLRSRIRAGRSQLQGSGAGRSTTLGSFRGPGCSLHGAA